MLCLLKPGCFITCFIFFFCYEGIAQQAPTGILQVYKQSDSIMNRRPQNAIERQERKIITTATNHQGNFKRNSIKIQTSLAKIVPATPEGVTGAACVDTSVRLVYRKDPLGFCNDFITKTRDGNILIPGWEYNPGSFGTSAHLIKCTQQGDTLWSKLIKCGDSSMFNDVYRAFELNDGSILLAGNVSVRMPYNGRNDPMIIRVSSTGDLIWEKTFKTRLWDIRDTTSGSIDIIDCKQDEKGDLYLCGDIRYDALPRIGLGFKMDLSGNVIWSRGYGTGAFPIMTGVNITSQNVTFLGRALSGNSVSPFGIVTNAATGDTIRTTAFLSTTGDFWHTFYPNNMVKLKSGNLALYGAGSSDGSDFDTTQLPTHLGIL